MSRVDVWVLPAAQPVDEACLDTAERRHAATYRSPTTAERHRRGRALLRQVVAERLDVAPSAVPLLPPPGPPELPGVHDLALSIAHGDDVVAVAMRQGGPVGIDVERRTPRRRPVPAVVLTPDRCAAVGRLVEPDLVPLGVWVLLEAALKAAGTGFTQAQAEISFAVVSGGVLLDLPTGGEHGCRLHSLADGVLVAVAIPREVPSVRWRHVAGDSPAARRR